MARARVPGRLPQLLRLVADELWGVHTPLPVSASAQNASPSAAHACDTLARRAARRQPEVLDNSAESRQHPARGWHGAAGWPHERARTPIAQEAQHGADQCRGVRTSTAVARAKTGSGNKEPSAAHAAAADAADGQTERVKKSGRRISSSGAAAVEPAHAESSQSEKQVLI